MLRWQRYLNYAETIADYSSKEGSQNYYMDLKWKKIQFHIFMVIGLTWRKSPGLKSKAQSNADASHL